MCIVFLPAYEEDLVRCFFLNMFNNFQQINAFILHYFFFFFFFATIKRQISHSLEWELLDVICMTAQFRGKKVQYYIIITFLFHFNSIFFILMFFICHVCLIFNAKNNEITNIRILNCIFVLFPLRCYKNLKPKKK